MSKSKELEEIRENIIRQEMKRNPILQVKDKQTQTPYGGVWSKLLTLNHSRPLRKGEILAQWLKNKDKGKREKFVWLGVIEKSQYDVINTCYKVYYRPFVNQNEKENERMKQLYSKQMF